MTDELKARLARTRFPRASAYDPRWVIGNVMGPHPLWLMEWLCTELDLPAGARVLDLGCGKALTSVFWLASTACGSSRPTCGYRRARTGHASRRPAAPPT